MTKQLKKFWQLHESMRKKIKSSSIYNFFIFLFLAAGALLRVYRLNILLGFWYDQGRDALVIWDLIHNGKYFLIGPTTGLAGVFRGPWYYYLIAPFYWLGRGNPVFPAVFLALSTVLGIYIIYKIAKKYFGDTVAFLFTFISSLSFYFLQSSRWLSNPTPMFLISALYLLGIVKVIEKKNRGWYLVALMSGFSMQFGSAAEVFYLPAAALFAILNRKYFPNIKTIFISAVLVFIPFVPQILFDARHGWIITKAISTNFIGGSADRVLPFGQFLMQRLNLYYDVFGSKIFVGKTIYTVPFLLAGIIRLVANWKKSFKNATLNALIILVFTPFVGLIFYKGNYGNLYDYYFTGYYFPIVLLFSYLVGSISHKLIRNLIIGVFILLFLWVNIPLGINYVRGGAEATTDVFLGNEVQAIDYIYKDAAGRQFNVDEYVPPVIPYAYRYLFLWLGETKYKSFPDTTNIPLLYTLEEVDPDHPDRITAWYTRQALIGKIDTQVRFGGIFVERRTRINVK